MSSRFLIIVVAFALFVAGAWMALKPPDLQELQAQAAALAPAAPEPFRAAPPPAKLGASSVLAIDPRANAYAKPAAALKPSLFREYLDSKQLKGLYERLRSSPEGQSAEGQYVLYEIAKRCATIPDRPRAMQPAKTADQRKDEFYTALLPTDPLKEKRVAAFEDVNTNRCVGFDGLTMTQADLNKMLADAVSAGDPKARALSIEQEIMQARRGWRDSGTLTDGQMDSLKQIIATRDPAAMLTAGRLMANTYSDVTMRLGPDGQVVEPRALFNAWQVLACDYGYPCGETNDRLLNACAYQSHCDATSLPDYLYYYGSSPYDSQLLSQYRALLRTAVETGDWSQLSVTRGPRPPGAPVFRQLGGR
jgi:hypothetical protein